MLDEDMTVWIIKHKDAIKFIESAELREELHYFLKQRYLGFRQSDFNKERIQELFGAPACKAEWFLQKISMFLEGHEKDLRKTICN